MVGRRDEQEALDRLLNGARSGRSGVLVLRGEAGVGKTALLEYLAERASGCELARATGVQAEHARRVRARRGLVLDAQSFLRVAGAKRKVVHDSS